MPKCYSLFNAIFKFHIKGITLQNDCSLGANWTFLHNKRFTRIGQSWYKHLVKKEFLKLIFAKTINNWIPNLWRFFFWHHWVTIRNTQHKVYFAYLFFNCWKIWKIKEMPIINHRYNTVLKWTQVSSQWFTQKHLLLFELLKVSFPNLE
jgi:hypothetical protein